MSASALRDLDEGQPVGGLLPRRHLDGPEAQQQLADHPRDGGLPRAGVPQEPQLASLSTGHSVVIFIFREESEALYFSDGKAAKKQPPKSHL